MAALEVVVDEEAIQVALDLVDLEVRGGASRQFSLGRVSPNPMSRAGEVEFQLPVEARVRLTVTDLLGREVAVLVDGVRPAGRHFARLDAASLGLRAGVFFVHGLMADREFATRVVVLP